jgi:hypothetical protein
MFNNSPQIFNRIKVWTIRRPVHNLREVFF